MNRFVLGIALSLSAWAQAPNRAEVQLQAAINKETVEGDLKGAIAMYRKIAAEQRSMPSVAARALLRLAQAQEKAGETEARKVYEQIIRDYGDQQPATIARARLAAIGKSAAGMVARRIVAPMPEWWTGTPNPTSPDGRYLFLSVNGGSQMTPAVMNLTTGQQRTMTKAPGLTYIDTGVVSADHRMVVYTGQPSPGTLDLIATNFDGSSPRTVLHSSPEVSWFYPLAITPDKKAVIVEFNRKATRGYNLGTVDIATGTLTVVKEFSGERLGQARVSPDGRWIAYACQPRLSNPNSDIFLIRTDGTAQSVIVDHAADDTSPVWSPDGKGILFITNRRGSNDLRYVPVAEGKRAGVDRQLRQDVGNVDLLGTTAAGSLIYRLAAGSVTLFHTVVDSATGKFGPLKPLEEAFSGTKRNPQISPDEKQIAYVRQPDYARNKAIIGIRELATGKEREIFPALRHVQNVAWMPDQQHLLVMGKDHDDSFGDFLVDARSGETKGVPRDGDLRGYSRGGGLPVVAPDGKTLYCPTFQTANGALFAKDLSTGSMRLIIEAKGYTNFPMLSPDGRWLSFVDAGAKRIGRIVPTGGGSGRDLPEGLFVRGWTRDGKSMYVFSEKDAKVEQRTVTVFRMPAEGGELVPVTDPINVAQLDSFQLLGTTMICRENKQEREIWALDNVMAEAK